MLCRAKILLVEDDMDQAMLFTQALELSGYHVNTVTTADEATRQLAIESFRLMLTDWDLPGLKGDALISLMRIQYPAMKTILYSNHSFVEELCAACGADACFQKMEGIDRLRAVIASVLPA